MEKTYMELEEENERLKSELKVIKQNIANAKKALDLGMEQGDNSAKSVIEEDLGF